MQYFLLLLGFALLIKGADYFVEGSSKIASLLRVPPLLVGLTIVAFGTSSPEIAVSVMAAVKGNADVALGNAVGSNIFMITLVIGVTAIIFPVKVEKATVRKEIPFTLLASIVLFVMMGDQWLQNANANENLITRSDGIILLCVFSVFIYYIVEVALSSRDEASQESEDKQGGSWGENILFTVGGLTAIIIGGNMVVSSSTVIALAWGMSETLVGLTIVAIGTSLPELITSITAAIKKEMDIAVGSIVGSCIFNILLVLGIASVITPLTISSSLFVVVLIMIVATFMLLIVSVTKRRINRIEGWIISLVYVGYMVYIILRT